MSIFIKPINEIEFEDVKAFCDEQIEENSRLEYKRAFSSKDEKKQMQRKFQLLQILMVALFWSA